MSETFRNPTVIELGLAHENADLRHRLECVEAVALELIAERDRAVEELGRLQQLSLLAVDFSEVATREDIENEPRP